MNWTGEQGDASAACAVYGSSMGTREPPVSNELLLALGIPVAYILISTLLLLQRPQTLPPLLQRLSTRRAIAWNTMVGLSIGVGALRWALIR